MSRALQYLKYTSLLTAVLATLVVATLAITKVHARPAKAPPRQGPATEVTVEHVPDGAVGCWRVSAQQGADQLGVSAQWLQACPVSGKPTMRPGEYALPDHPFYLSAWSTGTPGMSEARIEAALAPDTAVAEDVAGGLLFLPVTADGRGYFVAAWETDTAEGGLTRRMRVGHYGASPWSVPTSAGRIYLFPWQPTNLGESLSPDLTPDTEPAQQDEPREG